MNILNKKILLIILILVIGIFVWNKTQHPANTANIQQTDQLKIISTKPSPLNGAVIPPSTKSIEITFNHPLSISVLKYIISPPTDLDVSALGGNAGFGPAYQFSFKKPLALGQSYILTIFSDTKSDNNLSLGADESFSFKTVDFKGF